MNPFRAVQGELYKKIDIGRWKESHFLQFFDFVNEATTGGTIAITQDFLIRKEAQAFSGNEPFLQEIFTRVNELTKDPNSNNRKFYQRFMSMVRVVGAYVKEHPSVVTDQMRSKIEGNPRLAWMLSHYKSVETKIGVPIVIEDKVDSTEKAGRILPSTKDPNVKVMESVNHLADALHVVASSLTKKDLKKLSAKDKIGAAVKILDAVSKARNYKPNIGTLNQIVIHKAERDDLEKAMLDLADKRG